MIFQSPYTLSVSDLPDQTLLYKNTWLIILHASRTPPHVGLLIDGNYNSLTIKGHELDIHLNILLKTIQQKKIETLFLKLNKHPVFSTDYQKEICQLYIQQFVQVKPNESSCLNPIKLFLREFYPTIQKDGEEELLFELIEQLKQNQYIQLAFSLNLNDKMSHAKFSLPVYTHEQLQQVIKTERANYYKD